MASSRSLGTLTVDLIAKIAGFEQGLNKAERELDKRAKRMNDIAKKIGTGIGVAISAGLAGATAAAGAITVLTKQAINNADAMRDMSIRLGTSTETLSAFAYAASQTGTDIDTLGRGLKVLAKNAADSLNPTSEQAKVFAALGVTVTDASGKLKDMADLVPEIANKFKQLEDGTTKAALAQALFGKAGLDLTEFLNQGSQGLEEMTDKARALGIVIDGETAAAADEFNDQLGDLKALVGGLGLQVAKELLPQLNEMVGSLVDVVKEGNLAKDIATGIGDAFEFAGKVATVTAATFRGVAYDLTAVALAGAAAGKALSYDFASATGYLKAAADFRKMAAAESDKIANIGKSKPGSLFAAIKSGSGTTENGGGVDASALARALSNPTAAKAGKARAKQISDEEREAQKLLDTYQRLTGSFDERIALFGKEGEAAKISYDIKFGELSKLSAAQKADLLDRAERLDLMQKEADELRKRADAEQRLWERFEDTIGAIRDEAAAVGMSADQQEVWNNLKWLGADATDAMRHSVIAETEALQEQRDAMSDQIEVMDAIRDAGKGLFRDIIDDPKNWKDAVMDAFDAVQDRILDMISQNLMDQLFGKSGDPAGGSAGGGWFGSLVSAFSGGGSSGSDAGSLMDLFSGSWGFANGGNMGPYSIAPVNERGFEMASIGGRDYMLTGPNSVRITPNHMLGGGSGGVNQNIYVTGTVSKQSAMQLQQEAAMRQRIATARS